MGSKPFIKLGYVFDINDETDGQRIKVRVNPDDNSKSDNQIPYAYPLLPKHLNIKPKLNEAVLVLYTNEDNSTLRYYIGPVISQPQFLDNSPYNTTALSLMPGASIPPSDAPSNNSDSHGALSHDDDITIYGRKKSDVVLTDESVRIRCGSRLKKPIKGGIAYNSEDPAFIHLRHTDNHRGNTEEGYRSTATIVADEINLISNKSDDKFDVTDKKHLITDESMENIIQKAHQLPYGDILLEFLQIFRTAFENHVHNYNDTPDPSDEVKKLYNYNLEKILSKHVKIN